MPQRIHQRLPHRSSRPRDFGSRYEDSWLNLSPEEANGSEAERQYERKTEVASERLARQQHQPQNQQEAQQALNTMYSGGPTLEPHHQWQKQRIPQRQFSRQHKQQQYREDDHEEIQRSRPEYTRSSSRNSYQSPTESWSSKRSDRTRLNSTLESSDGSLDSARPVRRGSAHKLPRDSAVRDLQKKLVAASFTEKGAKLHDLFKRSDRSHSGGLNFSEFSRVVRVEGKMPEWKIDERMLQGLWNSLGAQVHEEISIAQCVDFVERDWSRGQQKSQQSDVLNSRLQLEPEPEPEPEPDAGHRDQARPQLERSARRQVYSPPNRPSSVPHKSWADVNQSADNLQDAKRNDGDQEEENSASSILSHDPADDTEEIVAQHETDDESMYAGQDERDGDEHDQRGDLGEEEGRVLAAAAAAHDVTNNNGPATQRKQDHESDDESSCDDEDQDQFQEEAEQRDQDDREHLQPSYETAGPRQLDRTAVDEDANGNDLDQHDREHLQQSHETAGPRQLDHTAVDEDANGNDFLSPTARRELKQVWDAVDQNGDGYLERNELRAVFDQVGPIFTDEEWHQAFTQIDVNRTGCVNFGEFRAWLCKYHVAAKAKILSGKNDILREAIAGGCEGDHAPVLFDSDSLAFANGDSDQPQKQTQLDQHGLIASSPLQVLQLAVASLPTLDPFNIPTDTALVVLLRKVVAGSTSRAFNVTITAEDEDMQVSFQQASRLCELIFPMTVGAAMVTAELARVLLVPSGAFSEAQTEAASRQQIIAEHSVQYRAKMSRAFDGADWFATHKINGIWACRAMLHYFVWFDRAWADLLPLVTCGDDAHVSEQDFKTLVRDLRVPLSSAEVSRTYMRLATVVHTHDGRIRGKDTVTVDAVCRWAVRSCVAREQGWPEPEEPKVDKRNNKKRNKTKRDQRETPKLYSSRKRQSPKELQAQDKSGEGPSGRGSVRVTGAVYKSSRSLGIRAAVKQHSTATEMQQAASSPQAVGVGGVHAVSQPDDSRSAMKTVVTEAKAAETEQSQSAAVAWPDTQVDSEVPTLPSRVPPFLR